MKRKNSPNGLRNKPEPQRKELRRFKMSHICSKRCIANIRENGFLQGRMAGMRRSNKKVLKKKDGERNLHMPSCAPDVQAALRETRRIEWNKWMKFNAGTIFHGWRSAATDWSMLRVPSDEMGWYRQNAYLRRDNEYVSVPAKYKSRLVRKFRDIKKDFAQILQLILEHSEEILNVNTIDSASPSWTSDIVFWSSDPVDKSKSTCIFRFRTMSGKDERQQRCNEKMGRSSGRSLPFLQGIAWNRWRTNWIRVEYSPRIFITAASSEKSRMIYENETLNLKNSWTGSSSCQCSTTSNGQENETMEFVFRIQKKSRNTRRYSRRDTGRSPVLETKRSGMELFLTHWKENGTLQPLKMVERFKDTSHPVFKSISALRSGILKKKNNRGIIHFSADVSNRELLFRIIHSVNQLSVDGPVSNWCEQIRFDRGRKGTRKTTWKGRIRDRRCIDKCEITRSKTFGIFSKTSIFGKTFRTSNHCPKQFDSQGVCEGASFVPRVSAGMSYKARPDEEDGFGQVFPLCR